MNVVAVVVVVVAAAAAVNNHASFLIRIVRSAIRAFSRKKKPGPASDRSGSNETVNYLSYSRHAGFVVSWKKHTSHAPSEAKKLYYRPPSRHQFGFHTDYSSPM